jgi:hypothetical protein
LALLIVVLSLVSLQPFMAQAPGPPGKPIVVAPAPSGGATNPIDADRRIDWTTAGATITDRVTVCDTIAAYTGTPATINTAISACSSGGGGVVTLEAGTFNLSDTVVIDNDVTLRGAGMSTILNFTGFGTGNDFFWGAGLVAVEFQGVESSPVEDQLPAMSTTPSATVGWSGTDGNAGTYTKGSTVLNLAGTPTGLQVGDTLVLYQSDEPDINLPITTWFVSDKVAASNAVSQEGASGFAGAHQQRAEVTAIDGTEVTITPGVYTPSGTWQTDLSPNVGWFDVSAGEMLHDAGLEEVRITIPQTEGAHLAVIGINWAQDVWIKGVGITPDQTGDAGDYVIFTSDSRRITIRDSWIERAEGGGLATTTTYGVAFQTTHQSLVENVIFDEVESPFMSLGGSSGNAILYNFENYVDNEGGWQAHQEGSTMTLAEGNSFSKYWLDYFHGNTNFMTFYRNHSFGRGFDLSSYHRWANLVGNVIDGATAYLTIGSDGAHDRFADVCLRLGYPGNTSGSPVEGVALDDIVATSALVWGNYCTSGDAVRFVEAEVPSSDPSYPNAVPADQTLVESLVYSEAPAFFTVSGIGAVTWPPIGPDVTGGELMGGLVYKLPAQRVFEDVAGDITAFDPSVYGE